MSLSLSLVVKKKSIFFSDEIKEHFIRFGPLTVDWPHKAQSKAYFPPKGALYFLYVASHL